MGEESTTNTKQSSELTNQPNDSTKGGSAGDTTTTNSEGGRGRGGRGNTAATEKEKPVGIPLLDTPDPKPVSMKLPEGAKPSTIKKKKKKQAPPKTDIKESITKETKNQIALLIQAFSEIAALRMGEIWKVSQQEAESVANPLGNILAKHDLVNKASEYSDYIALTTALGMIVVPRVMLSKQTKQKEGVYLVNKAKDKPETRESKPSTPIPDKQATTSSQVDSRQFLAGLELPSY